MRQPNTAIKRVIRPLPTPEEVLSDLSGAVLFSKVDLKSAYHQVELEPGSRDITTFCCHIGTFRYKRLLFGVSSACEDFQHIMTQVLADLSGVLNIADDIIVYGNSEQEHDENLHSVLKRLHEKGLTINKQKCSFKQDSVNFFGQIVSKDGIRPNIKSSLLNLSRPMNKAEIRSYLGMINFISKYIPNYSTITAPITSLLQNDVDFVWSDEQEAAHQAILTEIKSPRILTHYDPSKNIQIITDASPVGISAIMTQNNQPVTFISRKLSPVEGRYAQTEREALAIVWAVEKLHYYLYGKSFEVLFDHQPLQVLYSSVGKPSARIMRWVLRLLPYTFKVKYIPGYSNPADYLSRKPTSDVTKDEADCTAEAERYVNSILMNSSPNSMSLQEITTESQSDKDLQLVQRHVADQRWHEDKHLLSYEHVKQELTFKHGIILRQDKIVLPMSLRKRAIELAHVAHCGIVKTKQFLRSKVWWPGIDRETEDFVRNCRVCQSITPEGREGLEPLTLKSFPKQPFSRINIDLFGPIKNGNMILGIVDEMSKWPEVYILSQTKSKDVIEALNDMFGRFGTPEILTSDNGPQFKSWEFANFMSKRGIKHHFLLLITHKQIPPLNDFSEI